MTSEDLESRPGGSFLSLLSTEMLFVPLLVTVRKRNEGRQKSAERPSQRNSLLPFCLNLTSSLRTLVPVSLENRIQRQLFILGRQCLSTTSTQYKIASITNRAILSNFQQPGASRPETQENIKKKIQIHNVAVKNDDETNKTCDTFLEKYDGHSYPGVYMLCKRFGRSFQLRFFGIQYVVSCYILVLFHSI